GVSRGDWKTGDCWRYSRQEYARDGLHTVRSGIPVAISRLLARSRGRASRSISGRSRHATTDGDVDSVEGQFDDVTREFSARQRLPRGYQRSGASKAAAGGESTR